MFYFYHLFLFYIYSNKLIFQILCWKVLIVFDCFLLIAFSINIICTSYIQNTIFCPFKFQLCFAFNQWHNNCYIFQNSISSIWCRLSSCVPNNFALYLKDLNYSLFPESTSKLVASSIEGNHKLPLFSE